MKEEPKLTAEWLMKRGYTFSAAARRLGVSTVQVSQVVHGKRSSRSLEAKLLALPPRKFVYSEKISPTLPVLESPRRERPGMSAQETLDLMEPVAAFVATLCNKYKKGLTPPENLQQLLNFCRLLEKMARDLTD